MKKNSQTIRNNMFTFNNKEYDETTLPDEGKAAFAKLARLSEQKADLDIVINFWTSKLSITLPKEKIEDGPKSKK